MYKFVKIKDPNNPYDISSVEICVDSEVTVSDLLENFKGFLLACGYHFTGELEIVEEDTEVVDD